MLILFKRERRESSLLSIDPLKQNGLSPALFDCPSCSGPSGEEKGKSRKAANPSQPSHHKFSNCHTKTTPTVTFGRKNTQKRACIKHATLF
jgi:hypothetical protein